jgi:oligopeptide transport system substrate-binding protein
MKRLSVLLGSVVTLACLFQPYQRVGAATNLPPDAATLAQQVLHTQGNHDGPYLDWSQTVYNRAEGTNVIQEPLTLNDFKTGAAIPGAATRWSVSRDGRTWTFHLRKGLVWTDGVPLTADDFVFMFRHQADPKTGFDFVYYPLNVQQIHNWAAVNAGKLPLTALGVSAPDRYTVKITTDTPRPFLPSTLSIDFPEPAHLVRKYGINWCTNLSTMAFSGPYRPVQWLKGQYILLEPNPLYHGVRTHYLQKIYLGFGTTTTLADYQAGTVDAIGLDAGTLPLALQTMPKEIHRFPLFQVNYLTFNTYTRPFNDVRVRQAFNLAIDRTTLTRDVLKYISQPTYALLMKGFPGYDPSIRVTLDPARAQKLLAQAGYPGGKGFPALAIWLRNENGAVLIPKLAAEFIQSQLKKNLGISIGVKIVDMKVWIDAINKHTVPIFLAPYNYDYVDPSDFMDLFITGGRHAWSNATYDRIVKTADSTIHARSRLALYHQAQEILAQQVPAVFLWNNVALGLWKPRFRNVPDSVINNTVENLTRIYVAR